MQALEETKVLDDRHVLFANPISGRELVQEARQREKISEDQVCKERNANQ